MAPRTFELWFTGDDDEVGRTVFGSERASQRAAYTTNKAERSHVLRPSDIDDV